MSHCFGCRSLNQVLLQIPEHGIIAMGHGSSHDGDVYKFDFSSNNIYCYECLDKEIAKKLAQPLCVITILNKENTFPDIGCIKYYPKGFENWEDLIGENPYKPFYLFVRNTSMFSEQ